MSTWGDLLGDIRTDIKDTGSTPKWTDALLFIYARDAIRDYNEYFPLRKDRVQLTESGGAYALPSDYKSNPIVESPLGTFLEERQARPGARYPTRRLSQFYIVNGNIYLNGTPTDLVYLTYDANHGIPTDETDTTFVMTIPDADEELIRLYVKAKIYEQQRSRQASLDRFQPGAGDRRDNPLYPEVNILMKQYQEKVAERYQGGTVLLWRPGRMR